MAKPGKQRNKIIAEFSTPDDVKLTIKLTKEEMLSCLEELETEKEGNTILRPTKTEEKVATVKGFTVSQLREHLENLESEGYEDTEILMFTDAYYKIRSTIFEASPKGLFLLLRHD